MRQDEEKTNQAAALFDSDNEEDGIKINKKYAADFQSRKQKEELRKVKFQGLDSDSESSSSSSEDEDAELLTTKLDVNIMKTINALRNRDSRIYDGNTRFYEDEGEVGESDVDDDENGSQKPKKTKRKTYKDVIREQVLEQMKEEENGEVIAGNREDHGNETTSKLVYDSQQAEIRQAFLDSTKDNNESDDHDDDDSEDLLIVKTKHISKGTDENDPETLQELQTEIQKLEKKKLQGEYVDPKGEVKDGEKFLLDFFKKRSWIEKEENDSDTDESAKVVSNGKANDGDDSDASLEQLDEADNFEAKYNFRFEEAAAGTQSGADFSLVSYARGQTMETLRRKDETRREKRMARKERKAAERKAKEEQLKRLKNAKRQEMEEKLYKIKEVLGEVDNSKSAVDEAAILKLLEGDFDPEKFEHLMQQTYGDDFYQKEDTEWKSDKDVKEALKHDEDGDLLVGDDDGEGGLYDEEPDDSTEHQGETDQETYNEEEEWAEEYNGDVDEEPESELTKKLRDKMADELYKLDYEDIVAGIPTRFKYRKVEPNNYGLSTEEILFARDSTLKQYVSLKKMAPYREEGEYFVSAKKRRKFRSMLTEDLEEQLESENQNKKNEPMEKEESAETKKKKRRRLKKGKNESSETSKSEATDNQTKGTSGSSEVESKRKRKRKHKEKSHAEIDVTSTKLSPKEEEKLHAGTKTDSKEKLGKEELNAPTTKKKKKTKKSSKKLSVDGVSKSRLASYGL